MRRFFLLFIVIEIDLCARVHLICNSWNSLTIDRFRCDFFHFEFLWHVERFLFIFVFWLEISSMSVYISFHRIRNRRNGRKQRDRRTSGGKSEKQQTKFTKIGCTDHQWKSSTSSLGPTAPKKCVQPYRSIIFIFMRLTNTPKTNDFFATFYCLHWLCGGFLFADCTVHIATVHSVPYLFQIL